MPNTNDIPAAESAPGLGSATLWIVAIILTKCSETNLSYGQVQVKRETKQALSWRFGVSEDEARGAAVAAAMESCPGFSIDMVTVGKEERLSLNP